MLSTKLLKPLFYALRPYFPLREKEMVMMMMMIL